MIDEERRVSIYPVTTEGTTTIVHEEDWDGELFRLPWLATDDQLAAVVAIVTEAIERTNRIAQQTGRDSLASDLRKLLGWPSQWEVDQAHERLDRLEGV